MSPSSAARLFLSLTDAIAFASQNTVKKQHMMYSDQSNSSLSSFTGTEDCRYWLAAVLKAFS